MVRRSAELTVMLVAPLLGVIDAIVYITKGPSNAICIGGESACELSYVLGWISLPLLGRVHLSWLALAYFTLQAALAALIAWSPKPAALKFSLALYLLGTALIPYLAYIQISKIKGICIYCTAMYIFIIAGLASSLLLAKHYKLTI
jgi:uncharacterized membrane protein